MTMSCTTLDYSRLLSLLGMAIYTLASSSSSSNHKGEVREYCEADTFHARCDQTGVILITTAEYGRMRTGRCTNNTQHLGCSNNVLGPVSNLCSGRDECSFYVSRLINEVKQCSIEYRNTLEAAYLCVPVLRRVDKSCNMDVEPIQVSGTGYISSYLEYSSACASASHQLPWILRAKPGQRINITLLDFSLNSDAKLGPTQPDGMTTCTVYATIKDLNGCQTTTVCQGSHSLQWGLASRIRFEGSGGYIENDVYHSLNNTVEIRIMGKNRAEEIKNTFMLRYQVVGCEDPPLPPGAWMRRDDNMALFGCKSSGAQWTLKCLEGVWSQPSQAHSCFEAEPRSSILNGDDLPHIFKGLSFLVIIAVAVSVGITILLAGVIYIRRRRTRQRDLATRSAAPSSVSAQKSSLHYSTGGAKYQQTCIRYSDNEYNQKWPQDGRFVTYPYPTMPLRGHGPPAQQYSDTERPYSHYPASEHLYESPNFDRKDFTDEDIISSSDAKETVLHGQYSGQSV